MSKSIASHSPTYAGDPEQPETKADMARGDGRVSIMLPSSWGCSRWSFNGWTNSYPRMLWQSPRSWIKSAAVFKPCRICSFGLWLVSPHEHFCSWRLVTSGGFVLHTRLSATSEAKGHQALRVNWICVQCSENASRTPFCVLPNFLYLCQTPGILICPAGSSKRNILPAFLPLPSAS